MPFTFSFTTRDGAWGSAELLDEQDVSDATDPSVAINANGHTVVGCEQMRDDSTSAGNSLDRGVAHTCAPQSGWSAPQRFVSANIDCGAQPAVPIDDNGARLPRVDVDLAGNAIAVWTQAYDPVVYLWTNRSQNGASWSAPELIEISNAGPVTDVRLDVGSQGRGIKRHAAWGATLISRRPSH
ncbi:MAG: hypothetical protein KJO40_12605 [Deltaproteobacteria bacterium]|nr:hypothetical protein [Deltaproteobacteria bacterium]NND28111.1 hypothetical protein [Myxococcales bacterium]MBT8465288.1 hypothetical protein [Deltaproteobacteria bacterium]MBT8481578.1 hypothetical protein [Deltaproteobacteria bacterium]NNK07173.1 hypothetical protein [Myxococcales bacterium]